MVARFLQTYGAVHTKSQYSKINVSVRPGVSGPGDHRRDGSIVLMRYATVPESDLSFTRCFHEGNV